MHCPYCRSTDTRVLDSRVADDGASIRRRRTCSACEKRFTTVEQMQLTVLKRSGATEPFTPRQGRSPASARPARAARSPRTTWPASARQVEDALRLDGAAEVPAHEVGLAILGPLRELDEVAYLRFASVYRAFESADDFEAEIAMLRGARGADAPTPVERQPPARTDGLTTDRPACVVGKLHAPGAPTCRWSATTSK